MARTATAATATVHFRAPLETLDGVTLLRLPREASAKLPSRGQVAVHATIQGVRVDTVVEPDGERGHWIRVDQGVRAASGITVGAPVDVDLEVAAEWPEPVVPDDLAAALAAAPPQIRAMWTDITPMARWEWVRWVGATRNPDTRRRRVEVTVSKMQSGRRRPCCFDLSSCTDPDLARSGRLPRP